ncbi:MAG: hypothetical protein ACOCV1_00900 [Bacillota bacterium]
MIKIKKTIKSKKILEIEDESGIFFNKDDIEYDLEILRLLKRKSRIKNLPLRIWIDSKISLLEETKRNI